MKENNQFNNPADEILRQHILDRLQHDPAIDSRRIDVEVKNGVATLKGGIDTEAEKQLSENIARSIEGIIEVENHLHIDVGIAYALSNLAAHIQGDIIKDDEDN